MNSLAINPLAAMIIIDLLAITVLVFGIYFPKHRRSDLAVAFVGVNIGVLAVSQVLANTSVGAGLGLGLFGVLSIIRLRSSEISQREVAYYFSALALGLIAGLSTSVTILNVGMIALILLSMCAVDTQFLGKRGVQNQQIQLDRAITDPQELKRELAELTQAQILGVSVVKVDLVNDLTLVDARLHYPPKKENLTSVSMTDESMTEDVEFSFEKFHQAMRDMELSR